MKKMFVLMVASLLLMISAVQADPGKVIGDKSLLDAGTEQSVLVNLDDWFASHPLKEGDNVRSDKIFSSPREMIVAVSNRGPLVGLHYHTSADEIVIVYKGEGEMFINGKWVPVKAGDLHVNPRGVIHGTRTLPNTDLKVVSIFTPPQANGNDKVFLENPTGFIGNQALLDTTYKQSILLNMPEWFASHPLQEGKTVRGDQVYASQRSFVGLTSLVGVPVASHFHSSCEEIVLVCEGTGEMLINGEWVPVKAGDFHVNPRGIIHGTRSTGDQPLRVLGIFATPQANGNDKVIVE